jgi:hypothetical protein
MNNTLWCPFMNESCMGRMCACATGDEMTIDGMKLTTWTCGLIDACVSAQIVDRDVRDMNRADKEDNDE